MKEIEEKDMLITNLRNLVEEQRIRLLHYENKFKVINNSINSFNESKNQLNEGINFLQNSLIDKEKRLSELESSYVEREKELELLRQEIHSMKEKKTYKFRLKKIFNKVIFTIKNILNL
jgi:chromosome segregation ATPase